MELLVLLDSTSDWIGCKAFPGGLIMGLAHWVLGLSAWVLGFALVVVFLLAFGIVCSK